MPCVIHYCRPVSFLGQFAENDQKAQTVYEHLDLSDLKTEKTNGKIVRHGYVEDVSFDVYNSDSLEEVDTSKID